ncbi:MAG: HAD family hydrolase [Gemmatimonadota bacterium]
MSARAVFLDRDGVLNHVVMRAGRPASPRSVEELQLVPGAAAAVARLREAGFRTLVVTNQPDVARGLLPPAVLAEMMERVGRATGVDDVAWCPHDDRDGCGCRKPLPGMIHTLAERWRVDPRRSFLVGDGWKDMAAGRAAGCTTVLLSRPYNAGTRSTLASADLDGAVSAILEAAEGTV